MLENSVTLEWYEVDTGKNIYRITERQHQAILEADRKNIRFVQLDNATINVAFIREMKKVIRRRDLVNVYPIEDEEQKFIKSNLFIKREQNDRLSAGKV